MMEQSAPTPDPYPMRENGTARLWLSEKQWMAILERTERLARETAEHEGSQDYGRRIEPRLPAPEDTRCMIRLGGNNDDQGTYMVKIRDISTTGLGFYSATAFTPQTRCTVALQDSEGRALVSSAGVVWCKPIGEGLHDVGINFDQAIDTAGFTVEVPDTPA